MNLTDLQNPKDMIDLVALRVPEGKYIHFKTKGNKQSCIEEKDVLLGVFPSGKSKALGFFQFKGGDPNNSDNYIMLNQDLV